MEFSHKRILIVDDDPDVRLILRDLLEFQGYICEEAGNGAIAFERLRIHDFDLLITDYQMPEMDGLMLLKKMNENHTHDGVPVIMITGDISEELIGKSLQRGSYAVLEKPYAGEKILSLINQALKSSSCTCLECC